MSSHQTRTFSQLSPERFDRDAPQAPYLVFTLGPGKLQRLVVKIWSNDQGWCDPGLRSPDPYANSHTAFALALVPDGGKSADLELHEFQSNFRASRSIRCHTNIWILGPRIEDGGTPDEVHEWLQSFGRGREARIGVYPVARYQGWVNFVWKMEVEVVSEAQEAADHEVPMIHQGRQNLEASQLTDRCLRSVTTLDEEESVQLTTTSGNATDSTAKSRGPERAVLSGRGPRRPPLDEEQEAYIHGVVARIASRFPDCGKTKDLDTAVAIAKQAMRAVPKEHPDYVDCLNTLAYGLFAKFERSETLTDLRSAVSLTNEALEHETNEGPFRTRLLENLNGYLEKMFSHEKIEQNIDISIEILNEVLPTVSRQSPVYSAFLCTLAQGFYQRFIVSNTMVHLNEAISVGKDVIAAAAEDHPNRIRFLVQASVLLKRRYLRDGTDADLEEAIGLSREALDITPEHDFRRSLCLRDLAEGLHRRYMLFNAWSDLEESITLFKEAMSMTTESDPEYIYYLLKLGSMLNNRFDRTRDLADLETSIQNIRTVMEAVPEHNKKFRAELLADLGSLMHQRFMITNRAADLDEAIDAGRQAMALAPYAGRLDNLGLNLTERFETSAERDIADLNEGIEIIRKGLGTLPEGHPHRAGSLINLGIALHRRFAETGNTEDRDEAMQHFRAALGSESAPYNARVMAGQHLLTRSQSDQSTHEAFLAAKTTIGMLDSYAPLSLRPQDKQDMVSKVAGIASEAAAIALEDGQHAATALELLEIGRGIIASFFHDRRADVSLLEEKHPDLARGFREVRGQLDRPSPLDAAEAGQHETDQRFSASSRMKSLLATIRSKQGFERFLQPADEAEMRRSAAAGPIVVINVSSFRCDALIIEESGARVLPLPSLTNADVRKRSGLLRDPETLTWLWDAVVGPVLDFLGFKKPPRDGCWPRVWWIPTGPLVQFPLHAAGYHLESRNQTAIDRVVSSYSSSVKAIVLSRQSIHAGSGSDVVLVSMQQTPGQPKLHHAVAEVEAVQSVCATIALPCVKPQVTKEKVLSALETCRIFHFAGHGVTDVLNPLRSHLFLDDWESHPLTAESLMETNLGHRSPFLAYLSACKTGENANEELLDENIHLANAFQLAGFRHVIGTLWEVDDELCADMARLTYEYIVGRGITDESVSRGLHHATRQLRDRWARSNGASRGQMAGVETREDDGRNLKESSEHCDQIEGSDGVEDDARGPRTIGKTEVTSPLWVPYIHYGP